MAETSRSPLPRDPEYWEGLARQIREDASAPLAAYAAAHEVWYEVLARRAKWLAAASVAVMLSVWLSLPASESWISRWLERSLAPDDVAGALISGPEPPSVEALMVQFPPGVFVLEDPERE